MKTKILRNIGAAVCVSALTLAGFSALADDAATAPKADKHYTGTVTAVNPQEHTLMLKGFLFSKTFNLGDNCAYTFVDKGAGTISDLRPGERVKVGYQDAHGVLVADSVWQEPMRYEGVVSAIDPVQHTMTLHVRGMNKDIQIADNCNILLRDDRSGTLNDVQPGNRVTVTYETPNGTLTARQIAQTSASYTGTLTAIDLNDHTLKARAFLGTKKFNVADDCVIMVNGKPDGRLDNLRPDEKLVLSYDDINGINVVNRIAPAEAAANSVATTGPAPGMY